MILLLIISTLFADISIYRNLQIIYTQQQTPTAYSVLLNCTASIQQQFLSEDCWKNLKKLPDSKNKQDVREFFVKQCGKFKYSLEQMNQLSCEETIISKKRIQDYKKNDIYIDN